MRILALSPYHGGSHKAFHDGWSSRSRHAWSLLSLPAHHWKWRMRHAAIDFADAARDLVAHGESFDALLCTDMLNLAEFRGLAPQPLRNLPAVAYFHENQFTYPVTREDPRDMHLAFNNVITALAANAVWFNSRFHQNDFLDAAHNTLRRMPDYQPADAIENIKRKSLVQSPGAHIDAHPMQRTAAHRQRPLHIVWAARWEHDKNPAQFFEAMYELSKRNLPFELSVIGESFNEVPACFQEANERLREHIVNWGYQSSRADYERALCDADVFVSTSLHEFFGISAVESMLAGCFALLPSRLAYPDLLDCFDRNVAELFLYDGSTRSLVDSLIRLVDAKAQGDCWPCDRALLQQSASRYEWTARAAAMDDAIELLLHDGD